MSQHPPQRPPRRPIDLRAADLPAAARHVRPSQAGTDGEPSAIVSQSPTSPGGIVQEEVLLLARVATALGQRGSGSEGGPAPGIAFDQELISLRDQIAEARTEDVAPLVEQMSRVAALAAGRRRSVEMPVDVLSPYFAHMRLAEVHGGEPPRRRDILIGRKGYIDRASGVQIVDWRDAPVSQIYYRYDEGDDYDELVDKRHLEGVVEARRNLTIHGGSLRRIGCQQGTFVADGEGRWWEAEGVAAPTLEGGQGKAARPPRATFRPGGQPPRKGDRPHGQPGQHGQPGRHGQQSNTLGVHSGAVPRADKHLPEIAALIDPAQFELITAPSTGLVVIQGGAGSGKTTVALHRIAYLTFNDAHHFKPHRCLIVVPSQALERYVAGVLPALGVRGVPVVTFRGFARSTRRKVLPQLADRYTDETSANVSRLKKHPAMLGLLERGVAERTAAATAELLTAAHDPAVKKGLEQAIHARAHRPPSARFGGVAKWLGSPDTAVPPSERHRIELVLSRLRRWVRDLHGLWGDILTDDKRLREAFPKDGEEPVRNEEIAELVKWVTAQLEDPGHDEHAGTDPEARTPVDGGSLDDTERSRAAGRLDEEDDALILRLCQLVHGALYKEGERDPIDYDHIAIDEAQDLSAIEIKVLYEAAREHSPVTPGGPGGGRGSAAHVKSLTLAGDVAQRLVFDNAFHGWDALLSDIGLGGVAVVRPLRLSYRSTAPVMEFARAVLGPLAEPEEVVARDGAPVSLHGFDAMGEAIAFLAESLRSLASREPTASVALVARYSGTADAYYSALSRAEIPSLRRVRRQDFTFTAGVDVTDIAQVKGLEFDYVVLLDVTPPNYPDSVEARHMLHIGATRAAHQLWLLSVGPPSPLIPESLRTET